MSLELEKSMRIVSDLVSFCYRQGAEEFSVHIRHNADDSTEMEVSSPIEHLDPETLEEVRCALQLPRQHEVEQQYWELSGETEFSSQLSLVGAMTDATSVHYEDGVLRITVQRAD